MSEPEHGRNFPPVFRMSDERNEEASHDVPTSRHPRGELARQGDCVGLLPLLDDRLAQVGRDALGASDLLEEDGYVTGKFQKQKKSGAQDHG